MENLPATSYAPEPTPITYSRAGLRERDLNAVAYTKSLLDKGDTLVYIKQAGHAEVFDVTGFPLQAKFYVHSHKVLATGSSKFKSMLSDWEQHKIRRRAGLLGDNLPTGIKYVLDLTPPEEGDDVVALISDLSCPEGIRYWHIPARRLKVSQTLIGGKDEVTRPDGVFLGPSNDDIPVIRPRSSSSDSSTGDAMKPGIKGEKEHVEEYCPIRHRRGIERLLQIIEGKDPRLDSAPKVWTLVMLAKYFDCPRTVVDYVYTWMTAEPNCAIMELLPEASLRIGMALENHTITRSAYSVLVSETAMRVAARTEASSEVMKKQTRFMRPRDELDEDSINMIQHAGRDFFERIDKIMEEFVNKEMNWIAKLPEYKKVTKFADFVLKHEVGRGAAFSQHKGIIQELSICLNDFVRGRILWCLLSELYSHQDEKGNSHRNLVSNFHKSAYISFFGFLYNDLVDRERVMTTFFWEIVRNVEWTTDVRDNLIFDPLPPTNRYHGLNQELAKNHGLKLVSMMDLVLWSKQLNSCIIETIQSDGFHGGKMPSEVFPSKADSGYVNEQVENYMNHQNVPNSWAGDAIADHWSAKTVYDGALSSIKETDEADSSTSQKAADDHVLDYWYDDIPDSWGNAILHDSASSLNQKTKKAESLEKTETADLSAAKKKIRELSESVDKLALYYEESLATHGPPPTVPDPRKEPAVPDDTIIDHSSPFFSLTNLLKQVGIHVRSICRSMLAKGENSIFTNTDTLLCLTDDEYKYLPLWAGGNEDGSGGVYEPALPPAIAGPIGPGPAYHTGFSSASNANSSIDFDGESDAFGDASTTVGWSHAVDNGEDDHLDRRAIYSEEEFNAQSEISFADSETYTEAKSEAFTDPFTDAHAPNGKGKAVEGGSGSGVAIPASASAKHGLGGDGDLDADFFAEDDDEDPFGLEESDEREETE